jgi:hypothetical protein
MSHVSAALIAMKTSWTAIIAATKPAACSRLSSLLSRRLPWDMLGNLGRRHVWGEAAIVCCVPRVSLSHLVWQPLGVNVQDADVLAPAELLNNQLSANTSDNAYAPVPHAQQ